MLSSAVRTILQLRYAYEKGHRNSDILPRVCVTALSMAPRAYLLPTPLYFWISSLQVTSEIPFSSSPPGVKDLERIHMSQMLLARSKALHWAFSLLGVSYVTMFQPGGGQCLRVPTWDSPEKGYLLNVLLSNHRDAFSTVYEAHHANSVAR